MAKANPADLRGVADDLDHVIETHPDAMKHNPDLHIELARLRDRTRERWSRIVERPREEDSHG